MADLFNGILYHGVGASSAALCYTPEKKVSGWAWQTYWLSQAFVCWLLLPIVIAFITIPHLGTVLSEAPASAMRISFLLGMAYGIGGTAFGMAIRYVGFSLTYAIAVGISCVLGTLLPPLMNGTLNTALNGTAGYYLLTGVILGAIGIGVCGLAGRSKEKDLAVKAADPATFSLAKGLPLCLLAGILSAMYGFSLEQANPIAEVAAKYGAGHFQENVKYIFSNTGAFVTTLAYCIYLHKKNNTFGQFVSAGKGRLGLNYLMSGLTGLLWYGQFFFYGLGHVRMGDYKFRSWAIHMIMLVLFSAIAGLIMKEWKGSSKKTRSLLVAALTILVIAVLILSQGSKIGAAN